MAWTQAYGATAQWPWNGRAVTLGREQRSAQGLSQHRCFAGMQALDMATQLMSFLFCFCHHIYIPWLRYPPMCVSKFYFLWDTSHMGSSLETQNLDWSVGSNFYVRSNFHVRLYLEILGDLIFQGAGRWDTIQHLVHMWGSHKIIGM